MLAQVALKAYAAAFVLLILWPPPLVVPFTLYNIVVSTIVVGLVAVLLSISRGLSKHRAWARIAACLIFFGFGAPTGSLLIRSISGAAYGRIFWIQLWLLVVSILGLTGLLIQRLGKGKTEPLPPEDLPESGP